MNINPQYPNINFSTANIATEAVRKENRLRDAVPPVTEAEANAKEKALGTDGEQRQPLVNQSSQTQHAERQESVESQSQHARIEEDEQQQSDEQRQQQQQERRQQQQEQQRIQELKDRDTEVRIHEQAHASVGGQYAGSPSYTFEQGPDGVQYAVAGEVPIDVAPVSGDPEATIDKMQQVRAAALAPAEPSGADKAIASLASQQMVEAQGDLQQQRVEQFSESSQGSESTEGTSDSNSVEGSQATSSTSSTSTVQAGNAISSDGAAAVESTLPAAATASASASYGAVAQQTAPVQELPSLSERSDDVNARAGRVQHFYNRVHVPNFPTFTQTA